MIHLIKETGYSDQNKARNWLEWSDQNKMWCRRNEPAEREKQSANVRMVVRGRYFDPPLVKHEKLA